MSAVIQGKSFHTLSKCGTHSASVTEFLIVPAPRIRPSYMAGVYVGFHLEVFDRNALEFRAVGINFTQYKHAVLALRAIETGNEPREGVVTRTFDRRNPRRMSWRGICNALLVLAVLLALAGLLGGCAVDDFSRADMVREGSFQLVNAADALQTSKIKDRPDLVEGSSFTRAMIGEKPSGRDVAMYFGTLAISHYLISLALPSKWRPWFQYGTAAYSGYTVVTNCTQRELC